MERGGRLGEANSIIARQVMRDTPLEYQWLAETRFSLPIIIITSL